MEEQTLERWFMVRLAFPGSIADEKEWYSRIG